MSGRARIVTEDMFAERVERRKLERTFDGGDGGGPHMPDMARLIARVDFLEKGMDRAEKMLDSIDGRLRGVEMGVVETRGAIGTLDTKLDGKFGAIDTQLRTLSAKLPSWWQMIVVFSAIVGLLVAVAKIGV